MALRYVTLRYARKRQVAHTKRGIASIAVSVSEKEGMSSQSNIMVEGNETTYCTELKQIKRHFSTICSEKQREREFSILTGVM